MLGQNLQCNLIITKFRFNLSDCKKDGSVCSIYLRSTNLLEGMYAVSSYTVRYVSKNHIFCPLLQLGSKMYTVCFFKKEGDILCSHEVSHRFQIYLQKYCAFFTVQLHFPRDET
jgi:hypothetical protein